jgi:hypothetical protein
MMMMMMMMMMMLLLLTTTLPADDLCPLCSHRWMPRTRQV